MTVIFEFPVQLSLCLSLEATAYLLLLLQPVVCQHFEEIYPDYL